VPEGPVTQSVVSMHLHTPLGDVRELAELRNEVVEESP
jgi:hypothetical protein